MMKIDAITCCVGSEYEYYLSKISLPIWLDTLDSLTIVTKPRDGILKLEKKNYSNLKFVTTDIFTQYGAHFNKGAALCQAYAVANPTDWVLHVDSDIEPPENWRKIAERRAQSGYLSGAFRFSPEGERLDEAPLYPYGYFHLWNIRDRNAWRWPLFDPWYGHAGSYDANFTDNWPKNRRADLGFDLIHYGDRRTNWFGPGASKHHMGQLRKIGYRKARMISNSTGYGKIDVPKPKHKFWIRPTNEKLVEETLRAARKKGPFAVYVRCSIDPPPEGWELIPKSTPIANIKRRIQACLT